MIPFYVGFCSFGNNINYTPDELVLWLVFAFLHILSAVYCIWGLSGKSNRKAEFSVYFFIFGDYNRQDEAIALLKVDFFGARNEFRYVGCVHCKGIKNRM